MSFEIEEIRSPSGELKNIRVRASSLFTKNELAGAINAHEPLKKYPEYTDMYLEWNESIFLLEYKEGGWRN